VALLAVFRFKLGVIPLILSSALIGAAINLIQAW